MKAFARRRYDACDLLEEASKTLNPKDKQEKLMIADIRTLKQKIEDSVVLYIK